MNGQCIFKKIKNFLGIKSEEEILAQNVAISRKMEEEKKRKVSIAETLVADIKNKNKMFTSLVKKEISEIANIATSILKRKDISEEDIAFLLLYLPLVGQLYDNHCKWRQNARNNDPVELYSMIKSNSMIKRMLLIFRDLASKKKSMDTTKMTADLGAIDTLLKMRGK